MEYKDFKELTNNKGAYLIRGGVLRDNSINYTLIITSTFDNDGFVGIEYNNIEKPTVTARYDNLAELISSEFLWGEVDTEEESKELDKQLKDLEFIPSNEVKIDTTITLRK